jgi:type III secretory pathway lipoprotein EscJ
MKKAILISATLVSTMFLFGCGEQTNYTGCWKGEANMIFEVLSDNNQDFTIRNVNGDLKATSRKASSAVRIRSTCPTA